MKGGLIVLGFVISFMMISFAYWMEKKCCAVLGITMKEDFQNNLHTFRSFCRRSRKIISGWVSSFYPTLCDLLEMYHRSRRQRHVFYYSLECDFRAILDGYRYNVFEPYITVWSAPLPSVIQIQFITQKVATDEIAQEVLEHIVMKFRHYLTACGLVFQFLPYYTISGTVVSICILYCEYEQELPEFYKAVSQVILTKTDGAFGTLQECHVPKSDELLLGFSATKWDNGGIVTPFIWDVKKNPHLLISGPTGGGKSVLAQQVVKQLLERKVDLTICDFKAGGDWDGIVPQYAEYTACDALVDSFYQSFLDAIDKKVYQERYLLIDEFPSWILSKDSKSAKSFLAKISHIAFMGRSFGFHLILIGQQFNSDVLPTAIREQMSTRIYMGNRIYTESAIMLFPNSEIDKNSVLPNYHGYIATPSVELDVIVVPEVDAGKLKQELMKLGKNYA